MLWFMEPLTETTVAYDKKAFYGDLDQNVHSSFEILTFRSLPNPNNNEKQSWWREIKMGCDQAGIRLFNFRNV